MMRTSNPALSDEVFIKAGREAIGAQPMSISGTVNKTGILLLCLLATASWVWESLSGIQAPSQAYPWMIGGAIAGFIVAMVTIYKKHWSPFTAPIYALCEGLFVGGISMLFEAMFPGIVLQAVTLTFGTLFCLLAAYRSGLIRATENFKLGVVSATGGIALIYFASIILGFFGIQIPLIHESGLIGIGFSAFVVVIAALNLVLDFDFIENGVKAGAPKYMEWYAAFGLMVTLVWLYIEILKLLANLQDRR